MRTRVRLPTEMRTADGKAWRQRPDADPNNEQARIAAATGVSFRRHRRTVPVPASEFPADGGAQRPKTTECSDRESASRKLK